MPGDPEKPRKCPYCGHDVPPDRVSFEMSWGTQPATIWACEVRFDQDGRPHWLRIEPDRSPPPRGLH